MEVCLECGDELTDGNWYPSYRKKNRHICKKCDVDRTRLWRKENPEKAKESFTKSDRKRGCLPMNENKECAAFLGVHVAERVLRHVFKDVEVMPYGNPGYDIKCNRDKLIDVKSSCQRKNSQWSFHIRHNTTADYFLCLAFDNRNDLNVLHAWLLPGEKFNHLEGATIRPTTINKWDEYKIDIDKISACCNVMKNAGDLE